MIEFEEHLYSDDPKQGHADVRTFLKDVSYFFLGNGLVQAALQVAPGGEGTPIGLLVMDPERLRMKRQALTMDAKRGLEDTMLRFRRSGDAEDILPAAITCGWTCELCVPAARVEWTAGGLLVRELFYCPELEEATLAREVRVTNRTGAVLTLCLRTGVPGKALEAGLTLPPGGEERICFVYTLSADRTKVEISRATSARPAGSALGSWEEGTRISFNSDLLDRWFDASRFQLPAVVSRSGVVDASIWQYNREWVRDQSFMAVALTLAGRHETARVMLQRLLDDFVSDEGDTVDSSERRHPDEVELDQNGVLLYALHRHALWTGDDGIAARNWKKIEALAEYPLKDIFRHRPSGMFANRREYWERHRAHGLEPGLELAYQVFNVFGLRAAAALARAMNKADRARRWSAEAARLEEAILRRPRFAMVDERGFVKRRGLDGAVQETIVATAEARLPAGIPLMSEGVHYLRPDTSAVLPIAYGLVPPDSPLAAATLAQMETLWNQAWDIGGYGRYHYTSEPDSAGPWPFASLFIARACVETGDYANTLRILEWLATLPGAPAGSWFEFYGPRISPPYPQIGIIPWTWAEMLFLLIHHILGVRPEDEHLRFRPKLLPGMTRVGGSLPLRGGRLNIDIKTANIPTPEFKTDAELIGTSADGALLGYRAGDITVEARLPRR